MIIALFVGRLQMARSLRFPFSRLRRRNSAVHVHLWGLCQHVDEYR